MKIVLVGNPNSGKTTIFNYLTNQHKRVGNWSGVTIQKQIGIIYNTQNTIIDLPGIYSLSPLSIDEEVTINYLKNSDYDLIVNVIDINLIERSLFLTYQLLSLNKKIVIIFTHTNKYNKNDLLINKKVIEEELKIKVINIIDLFNIKIIQINNYKHNNLNNRVNKTKTIMNKLKIHITKNYLDKIFLNRIIGIPIFIIIMLFIYYFSIIIVGNYTNNLVNNTLKKLSNNILLLLNQIGLYKWLISLIIDGIIKGISILISFIPQLFIMFLLTELLNQTGYISRISYLLDGLLNKIGLSGKSIISFIVATNCTVPGIIQSRIINSKSKREKTILLTPFIPCSAKLPLIIMISNYLGINYLIIFIYILIIIIIITYALILNKIYKKEEDYTIIELPSIQIPKIKNVITEVVNKIKELLKKISSLIVISSLFIWLLFNITCYGHNILFHIGKYISNLFYPFLGSNNWILSISILEGIISREHVISSLNIIGNLKIFTNNCLLSFLIFNLLNIPCINTIIVMKKELGLYKVLIFLLFEFIIAFIISTLIYRLEII